MSYQKIAAISIFFALVIISVWSFAITPKLVVSNEILRKELASTFPSPVSLFGSLYNIEEDHVYQSEKSEKPASPLIESFVLHLANFSTLTRVNPIFGIENTNPELLKQSVQRFKDSLNDFATTYNPEEEKLIRETLYPLAFLKTLAETEQARIALIQSPSISKTIVYNRNLRKTINQHQKYTERLIKVFEKMSKSDDVGNTLFHFLGGRVDSSMYINALNGIILDTYSKKRVLNERIACIFYYNSRCSVKGAYQELLNSVTLTNDVLPDEKKERDVFENRELLASIFPDNISDGNRGKRETDFIYAVSGSTCFSESLSYYKIRSPRVKNGWTAFKIAFLNELYFYDINKIERGFLVKEREKGVSYAFQLVSNAYMCPNLAYDLGKIASLNAIREVLTSNPIPQNIKDIFPEIEELEKKSTKGPIIYEKDVLAFINILAHTPPDLLSKNSKFFIESLLILYHQKSPQLDRVINGLIIDNAIIRSVQAAEFGMPIQDLFLSRSYPAITLLTFNRSISRNDSVFIVPEYPPTPLSSFNLRPYQKDLSKILSRREIEEELQKHKKLQLEFYDGILDFVDYSTE